MCKMKEMTPRSHSNDPEFLVSSLKAQVIASFFAFLSDRDRFQLGTLSHSLNIKASGYQELSDWPAVAPDQSVRNVEVIEPVKNLI